jgi:hypothetical protein
MKIGILTFHRPSNFGANLQAYASTSLLKKLGHEVKVIDFVRKVDLDYGAKVPQVQFLSHMLFIENNLPLTCRVSDADGLRMICRDEKFDLLIIGADAVWRVPKDGGIYFATWVFDTPDLASTMKVASMSAAHMGNGFSELNASEREVIKDCLEHFSYISVRDTWTRDKINHDIFGNQEYVQIINYDPVFMLSRYVENVEWDCRGQAAKGYLLMSLPKNWLSESGRFKVFRKIWFYRFKKLVRKAGLKLIEFPIPEGKSGLEFDFCVDYPIDPIQWFLWIKNAKGFIGLRYHAIVSSISNCTPFFSIDSYGSSSPNAYRLDYLGLHKRARSLDVNSKIRNLLLKTPFERNRTGRNLETESPKRILSLLLDCQMDKLVQFKEHAQGVFEHNMEELLKTVG